MLSQRSFNVGCCRLYIWREHCSSSWKSYRYVWWHHCACYHHWYDQDHQTFVTWLSNHHTIYHHHSAGNSAMGPGPPGKEWLQRRPSKGEKKTCYDGNRDDGNDVVITIVMVVWFGLLSMRWGPLWWCQESHSGFKFFDSVFCHHLLHQEIAMTLASYDLLLKHALQKFSQSYHLLF